MNHCVSRERRVEIALDVGQRDVHHRDVEQQHEDRHADHDAGSTTCAPCRVRLRAIASGGLLPPTAETLRRTPLYDRHEPAGAKLVPFAGWEMPVQYEGIRAGARGRAHGRRAVRRLAHGRGRDQRARRRGLPPARALQRRDARSPSGGAQYSVLCREDGGVLDDLFTYRLGGDRFLTVTNASNHESDLAWFREHAEGFDVEVHDALARLGDARRAGPASARRSLAAARRRRAAGADAHGRPARSPASTASSAARATRARTA